MTYRGYVKGGVVVLEKPLPEGMVVDVSPHAEDAGDATAQRAALLVRGRELVRRVRQRNRDVAPDVIEREVHRAIEQVRARGRS